MTTPPPCTPIADTLSCVEQITATEMLGLLLWRMQHPGKKVPRLLCSNARTVAEIRALTESLLQEYREDERQAATARSKGDARAFFVSG